MLYIKETLHAPNLWHRGKVVHSSFSTTISREAINALPVLKYGGEIRLIKTEKDLQQAFPLLEQETLLGFDTESRPSFRKGDVHPTALVQFAAQEAVYIFQLNKLLDPTLLFKLLENPSIKKAGIAIADDIRRLQAVHPYQPHSCLEIGILAHQIGIKHAGLRSLAAILLKGRVTKTFRTSNWANEHLTEAQLQYAATDAWVSRQLFLKLEALAG